MIDIVKKSIIPASVKYQNDLAQLLERKNACGDLSVAMEKHLLSKLSALSEALLGKLESLENSMLEAKTNGDRLAAAKFYRNTVFCGMTELRLIADELETIVGREYWSLPTYAELLYSVN